MRIKKLELFGFKSFKDRTVIQFDEGITGVVGPNGCGKSNIVDALLWVMGEMSAKQLRGSSMDDVIFAGAEGYAPMGMAEVSLTLENDGGAFPVQYMKFSEIMVTRRLNRSGESEYFINKEPARLRDIQEIFMDTGAGSKGFSIIAQGAIGKIVTSKPEDRRVLIEEAAGITKFKVRKRESQRKLESTDQNLVRLQDIIGEQKRQIDSLERQAQRAERYRKIKTELQEKELWLSAQSFLKMHEEATEADRIFNESRDLSAGSEGKVSELEANVARLRLELAEKEISVQTKQAEHRELVKVVQETEFRIRELNFTIEQARRSNEMTGSMLSQYQLRKENLESEKESVETKLLEAREDALRLQAEYEQKNAEYTAIQERILKADLEVTDKRREMLGISAGLSHVEAREGGMKVRVEENTKRVDGLRAILAELETKKTEFQERRNRVFKSLETERQMQLDFTKNVDTIAENLNSIRSQITQRRADFDGFKDELNQVASRLYGLENMQANFEGFEEGVKNVMMWQRTRREQVTQMSTQLNSDGSPADVGMSMSAPDFKPLAEVVEVPARYELAMEASLGSRLQVLLGGNNDESLSAVDYLKSGKSGRSSFLANSDFHTSSDQEAAFAQAEAGLRTESGVEGLLKDVVQVPDGLRGQVAHFFSDVVIVDSIRTALRLRSNYPGRTFVTIDGDTLSRDGVLTGGASDSADSGVLKRRREIKELSLRREELSGKVQFAQLTLKKLEDQEEGIEKELENAKKSAVEKEILIAELRKDLERAETELGNAVSAFDRETRQIQKEEADLESLKGQLTELSNQIEEMRAKKAELEFTVEALQKELEAARNGIEFRAKEVTDLRVTSAGKKQEAESLEREQLLIDTTLSDLNQQLSQMSEETERNQSTLSTSQVQVEESQSALTRLIHQTTEAERAAAVSRDEFEQLSTLTRSQEEELSTTMKGLNELRSKMNDSQLKLEQLKMKETYLVDQINERYMINLRERAFEFKDVPGDIEAYTRDVEELKDKIKRIGEVNLSAINEYDEVIKRYEFLTQQHNDLIEAKENLRKVIDRINRICSKRFKDTFDQVNERFEKVFPVLFGGGEARLILIENPEDDEMGIDIVAKPPGKKMQSVSLLSGGEKALTAVSLVFSIFLVKPSPFCLLDEVDAPLDDANVFRFNDLVKEMAKRSQIIVVTHNKHTMKVNKKLYGVTMQEKGVSKMVSVSLADAEKIAAM